MADPAALARRAIAALGDGNEAEVVQQVADEAARIGNNALLWQCTGLLHRALDAHGPALAAFQRASQLAPADPRIAQGHAQVALEAGLDAVALFDRARRLNPADGSVHLGMAAARFAAGDGAGVIAELGRLLAGSPAWVQGHATLARVRTMMGEGDVTASFERALVAQPGNAELWHGLIATLVEGERHEAALDAIGRARTAIGASAALDAQEAAMRSELGDVAGADALFARLGTPDEAAATHYVRHLLRTGRVEAALPLIDRWTARADAVAIWPYAAAVWRLAGDPRHAWLEGDARLVSVVDLADRLPDLDALAGTLRRLHLARAQPLDQSVRGGTQTDGALLQRLEPEIQALRAAIVSAVEAHVAQLPPVDPAHPTLRHRRDRRIRFAGSWSVRLAGGGHHANHIHQAGWLSSALYVALPKGDPGLLTLGEPQAALGLDLPPLRTVEPRPGRLVLFPSTMWHGTRPFAAGERLTVAFDIARPR